jgi:hypothetical protein
MRLDQLLDRRKPQTEPRLSRRTPNMRLEDLLAELGGEPRAGVAYLEVNVVSDLPGGDRNPP